MKDSKIDIYGDKWKVKYVSGLTSEGHIVAGLCDYRKKTLFINKDQTHKQMEVSLLHELFHAYCYRMGIHNANYSFDLEEIQGDQFATLLAEIFDFEL